MLYVGLDVHSRQSSLCILNAGGGIVNQIQLKGPRSAVVDRLRQLDQPFAICYEASCGYGHLYEQLRPLAAHLAVAHPGKLRLIYKSKRKNDRVDAHKLAKMLLLDMVPRVHVPHIDIRAWRSLIILRQRVMAQVVRAKNQIRGVLRENDIAGAKWLWSRKQLAWLESLELHPAARLRLELAVEEFKSLDQKIKRLEAELQKYADRHPAVRLLMTIPGVGIRRIGLRPPEPRPSSRGWMTSRASAARGSWALTSDWCRARTPAPTRTAWATSPATGHR